MRHNCIILVLLFIFSCSTEEIIKKSGYSNFSIIKDQIYIDGMIDSLAIPFFFDTGCLVGCIINDSIAHNLGYEGTSAFSNSLIRLDVDTVYLAGFANRVGKVYLDHSGMEPMIAPVYSIDRHVWHFDFDSCKFSILDEPLYANTTLRFPLTMIETSGEIYAPFIRLPIKFIDGKDTLSTDYYYLLDTGTPEGVTITDPTDELLEFISNHPYNEYLDEASFVYSNRKIFQFYPTIEFKGETIESVKSVVDTGIRSLKQSFSRFFPHNNIIPIVGTVGVRILKHFNFEIDLLNGFLYLVPNNADFPSKISNKYGFWCNKDGSVRRIELNGSAFRAGLRIGDKISRIDGACFESFAINDIDSILNAKESVELTISADSIRIMKIIE